MPIDSPAALAEHLRAFAAIHAERRDGHPDPAIRATAKPYAAGYERALAHADRGAPASVVCRELDWWQRILANCRRLIAAENDPIAPLSPDDWTPPDFSVEEIHQP